MAKKIHDIKKRVKYSFEFTSAKSQQHTFGNFWVSNPGKEQQRRFIMNFGKFSKALVVFALVSSLLMIAFGRAFVVKADLEYSAYSAKDHLNHSISYLKEGNYDKAFEESSQARSEIEKIKLNLQSWGQNSQYLRMIDYKSDLVGIENLINVADQLLSVADSSKSLLENMANNYGSYQISDAKDININLDINQISQFINDYSAKIDQISTQVAKIEVSEKILSGNEKEQIISSLSDLKGALSQINSNYMPLLQWLSGAGADRKIMLVFQNNSEIRGSGGFIGSYAILNTADSVLKRIDFQTNIYKLDTAAADKISIQAPPEYDTLAAGKFYLRDANYAVDGPESFAQIINMYQLESGDSVDGIIAIDTSLVTDLLSLTGPIDMPQYNMAINSDNFLDEVQYEVEKNYFTRDGNKEENEPKKILADMMPTFINKVFKLLNDNQKRGDVLQMLNVSLLEKHLQLYSKDQSIQQNIVGLGISGQVPRGDYDFFFSHSTNIGGGKSSLNMDEDVRDDINIDQEGYVHHNVTITRKHNGTGVWPDNNNINLMRILTPSGSSIDSFTPILGNFWPHMVANRAKDPDHYMGNEAGKNKLSFWMNTKPQETSQVSFSYISGKKISVSDLKQYRLYLEKQAGAPINNYHIKINYPEGWNIAESSLHTNVEFDFKLDRDKLIEVAFK